MVNDTLTSRLGTGKIANLFYSVRLFSLEPLAKVCGRSESHLVADPGDCRKFISCQQLGPSGIRPNGNFLGSRIQYRSILSILLVLVAVLLILVGLNSGPRSLPMQLHSGAEHLRKVIYRGIITRDCS